MVKKVSGFLRLAVGGRLLGAHDDNPNEKPQFAEWNPSFSTGLRLGDRASRTTWMCHVSDRGFISCRRPRHDQRPRHDLRVSTTSSRPRHDVRVSRRRPLLWLSTADTASKSRQAVALFL